ncbi:MAG: hypothetical protein JW703_03760 [Candidatus Diapherotrites archaeon]|nr:hypothetical protein [Candidatus Diapherotrites archaeon]
MISDFVKAQKISSKVIESKEEIYSLNHLLNLTNLGHECFFKSKAFMAENNHVWIVLFPWGKHLSEEKVKQAVPLFEYFISGTESEEITGYLEDFVPPIGVYDARVLIDSSFEKKEKIAGIVESPHFLLMLELNDLTELVDEIVFAKITK